jgi:hypothetical protein
MIRRLLHILLRNLDGPLMLLALMLLMVNLIVLFQCVQPECGPDHCPAGKYECGADSDVAGCKYLATTHDEPGAADLPAGRFCC